MFRHRYCLDCLPLTPPKCQTTSMMSEHVAKEVAESFSINLCADPTPADVSDRLSADVPQLET